MKCICCQKNEAIKYSKCSSGKFCSRKCAYSYSTKAKRKEINKKVSIKLIGNHNSNRKHKPLIKIKCKYCKKIFETKYENQKYCSHKCHDNYRRTSNSEYINYKAKCQFKFGLSNYSDEFDFTLIEKYGMYKAKNRGNNLNGVSRDHIISIKYGFKNNIPTEMIAHPANCQLLKQSENASKYKKCGMTINELKNKINKWNKKYL